MELIPQEQAPQPKYDPYTYMVIDFLGKAHYVSKREFDLIDESLSFTKRKVSRDGLCLLGYLPRENPYER